MSEKESNDELPDISSSSESSDNDSTPDVELLKPYTQGPQRTSFDEGSLLEESSTSSYDKH